MYRLLLLLPFLFMISCNEATDSSTTTTPPNEVLMSKGFGLIKNNCISCHSANPDVPQKVAPTLMEVKTAYLAKAKGEAAFEKLLTGFIKHPTENIQMPEAVNQYGVMPVMNYSEDQIAAIAHYIYHTPLEKPNWYAEQYSADVQKYSASNNEEMSPLERGKSIAMKTKGTLGKNLLNAIKTKGTEGAISFCSAEAYPLTDSVAISLNAQVKRVSDKNRNPKNKANADQLAYIEQAKLVLADGKDIKPAMKEIDGKIVCYYPIITNEMCLQCHGTVGQEVKADAYAKIQELYPEDQAVGYGVNELRGIWVVRMDAND
ncbi:MAG: DUF3365 domain-containing protein [Saprospiraceae bacterium]|nr:DUF3365 domain-containing protein [Saprospiraceae bacterium]